MMLPILISVSLAPGSYFFCALAGVAVMAMAAAHPARAMTLLVTRIIVSLPLGVGFLPEVSQATRALASIGLFRCRKRHCCAAPIVVISGDSPTFRGGRFGNGRSSQQATTSRTRKGRLPPDELA